MHPFLKSSLGSRLIPHTSYLIPVLLCCLVLPRDLNAQKQVGQWDRFEITLDGPRDGNPFTDVSLSATFLNGGKKMSVSGFYDGNGIYKIRFMPGETGEWKYTTHSNIKKLSGLSGTFRCIAPSAQNHGPVRIKGQYHFEYADHTPYYPFGTTCYAWTHQGEAMESITLNTLASSPFNKIRMCVFPKRYKYNENEPEYYPFEKLAGKKPDSAVQIAAWNFKKFNPEFFRHLEKRIDDLMHLGIEADLILFHPYDRGHWGFDRMDNDTDKRYLAYLQSRLASYRNVWWSLANEYDYMKEKTAQDWDAILETVKFNDPYEHLCGAHNGDVYFDSWRPAISHASIQNGSLVEDFGRAVALRDAYKKPVVYDEVCYEGNLPERWGNLTPEEMVHRFWQGIIAGTYVTHGETYLNVGDTVWWAKGGRLHGKSPERIAFLRKIVEENGTLELIDKWKNTKVASQGTENVIIYFGKEMSNEWTFSLPAKSKFIVGTKVTADIIDTWNMTITPVVDTFITKVADRYTLVDGNNKKIKLPGKPYQAIRLRRL